MSKAIKQLRGQVRQIVQEVLPDVLAGEVYSKLQKTLLDHMLQIQTQVQNKLNEMDNRTKDVQGLIMRQVAGTTALTPGFPESPPQVMEVKE